MKTISYLFLALVGAWVIFLVSSCGTIHTVTSNKTSIRDTGVVSKKDSTAAIKTDSAAIKKDKSRVAVHELITTETVAAGAHIDTILNQSAVNQGVDVYGSDSTVSAHLSTTANGGYHLSVSQKPIHTKQTIDRTIDRQNDVSDSIAVAHNSLVNTSKIDSSEIKALDDLHKGDTTQKTVPWYISIGVSIAALLVIVLVIAGKWLKSKL